MNQIDQPGVYDIPEADYHADPVTVPSLSSSVIKVLDTQSPLHAWLSHPRLNPAHEPKTSQALDRGSAAHLLLTSSGETERLAVIDADDFRTKAAKEQRDAAHAAGRIPILRDRYEDAQRMAKAARMQIARTEEDQLAFSNGRPEAALIWQERDVWCRALLDWLPSAGTVFHDYKTTGVSANPADASRIMANLGYDIQAAFYRRGIRAVLGIDDPVFRFVVQENEPPFCLSVWQPSPAMMAIADAKIDRAIAFWRWCLEHDRWPGYPRRVAHIDPPPWEVQRVENEQALRDLAKDRGEDLFALAIEFQAPGDAA